MSPIRTDRAIGHMPPHHDEGRSRSRACSSSSRRRRRRRRRRGIVVVALAREDFLNSVCTHTVWLHQKTLTYYGGSYSVFCKVSRVCVCGWVGCVVWCGVVCCGAVARARARARARADDRPTRRVAPQTEEEESSEVV